MAPERAGPVRLVHHTTGPTRIFIEVYIDAETGDLVFDGQDIGPLVEEWFGDSDYEYWLVVKSISKPAVMAALTQEQGRKGVAGAAPARPPDMPDDELLLALIAERYRDDLCAVSRFRAWCEDHNIPTEFSSYA
jgi:hypothetical protein